MLKSNFKTPSINGRERAHHKYRLFQTTIVLATIIINPTMVYPSSMIEQAKLLEDKGEFTAAVEMLKQGFAETSEPEACLEFEREIGRLKMIRRDYRLQRGELLKQLKKRIPDFHDEELDAWEREGRFDTRIIDGIRCYLRPSVSNLIFRYEDISKRVPPGSGEFHQCLLKEARERSKPLKYPGLNLIRPYRFHVRMNVTPDPDALPASGRIRCWIPFPRSFPFQEDITLISANPEPVWIGQPESTQRTIYFEDELGKDKNNPPKFEIEYAYTIYSRAAVIDESKVDSQYPQSVAGYALEEEPHVVFTQEMIDLSREIVDGEDNPARMARKIFKWCVDNLKYSYAPEYGTIPNIGEWVRQRRYGDCGQLTIFFMTLCRIQGIPVRWQSGWMLFPDEINLHDWCEIYLHPYGWLPVDTSFAVGANRSRILNDEEKKIVVDSLFASLDHYRMAANAGHGVAHVPPKISWRTDPVDSQRGELEVDGKTIAFDDFDYHLEVISCEPIEP